MNMINKTEEDNLRFSEGLSDFVSLIGEHGAAAIAQALVMYFPQPTSELEAFLYEERLRFKTAALFRKP